LGRSLEVTAFKICRNPNTGVRITKYGIATGSGRFPANNSVTTNVGNQTGAACDTITMADVNEGNPFEADAEFDRTFEIEVFVEYPVGGGSALFGGAQLTLEPAS
jgi:hypothetical protein